MKPTKPTSREAVAADDLREIRLVALYMELTGVSEQQARAVCARVEEGADSQPPEPEEGETD